MMEGIAKMCVSEAREVFDEKSIPEAVDVGNKAQIFEIGEVLAALRSGSRSSLTVGLG